MNEKIIFVCTGNTCRSPMAEYMGRAYTANTGQYILFSSAGIKLKEKTKISRHSQQVLNEEGINASNHIPQQLTQEMINNSDYIITMTHEHKKIIQEKYNVSDEKKLQTLYETIGKEGDIKDPYDMDIETYRETKDEIKGIINKFLSNKNINLMENDF